jgi:hypothetical protein
MGPAEGTADPDKGLQLAFVVNTEEGNSVTQTNDWRSDLVTPGTMSGTFTLHRSFTNAFGPQTGYMICRFEGAERVE